MVKYSRANPSPRYQELIQLNRRMHLEGDPFSESPPEETFEGRSLPYQAKSIKDLIAKTGARTLIDYGCGKAMYYDRPLMDFWGIDGVTLFDPAYPPHSILPTSPADGVICTDVLEHCPEEDLHWIVDELFRFSKLFVFASISSGPARKRLPNGGNAHVTQRPATFWRSIFRARSSAYPTVHWEIQVKEKGQPSRRVSSTELA